MNQDSENLGPLPKADRNAELQRKSIAQFQASLPPNQFVFRDERSEDAGVDGSLEVLVDGKYTNLRSQVQLKATDADNMNSDGSVSLSVRVANLNYLLNGPSPIYVLHIESRDELRFAWARDERRRLDQVNPEWPKQESITIRFDAIITRETLQLIHQRIREEAQFQRKLTDILDSASSTEQIVVRIDSETLAITDPQEAKRILLNSGTAIVSAGYAREVKNLIRLLDEKDAQTPRILLVQAHAEFNQRRYESALALIRDASLNLDQLSEEDQLFLRTVRDGSEFQTGRITIVEFSHRLDEITRSNTGGFALSNRLTQLRYALHAERGLEQRVVLLAQLQDLVNEVVQSEVSTAFKIHARICLVEAEGYQFVLRSMREIGDAHIRLMLGRNTDFASMFASQSAAMKEWNEEAVAVLTDANELGSPTLVADAMLTRGSVSHMILTNQKVLSAMFQQPIKLSDEFIESNINNAKHAVSIFNQAGNLEGELRSKMLIADLFDLMGRKDDAREIASYVLPRAKAMNYAATLQRAEDHLSGRSFHSKLDESSRPKSQTEKAQSLSQKSHEEMRADAVQMLTILDLPAERLPVLEREYESLRSVAREQLSWCSHIEIIQDKRHELHPSTHYRTDPTRFGMCTLHGYRSNLGNSDWLAVIELFKATYCEGCPDKCPLKGEEIK
jgi:hypothetical protein